MEPINKIAKEKEPSPTINLDDTLDCSFSIPNIILEIISENNIEKSSEKCINIVLFNTLVTLREPKSSKMFAKLMLKNLTR